VSAVRPPPCALKWNIPDAGAAKTKEIADLQNVVKQISKIVKQNIKILQPKQNVKQTVDLQNINKEVNLQNAKNSWFTILRTNS